MSGLDVSSGNALTNGESHEQAGVALAFAIGAAIGVGLAAIWVPKRRNRLPAALGRRYQRVRKASAAALDELRDAAREISGDFREELGTTLEAAREELVDIARKQLDQTREIVKRERRRSQG